MSLLDLLNINNETKEDNQLVLTSKKSGDSKSLGHSDFKTIKNKNFGVPGNHYSMTIFYYDYRNYEKGGMNGDYKILFRIEESLQVSGTGLYNKNTIFIGIDNIEYLEKLLKKIRLITYIFNKNNQYERMIDYDSDNKKIKGSFFGSDVIATKVGEELDELIIKLKTKKLEYHFNNINNSNFECNCNPKCSNNHPEITYCIFQEGNKITKIEITSRKDFNQKIFFSVKTSEKFIESKIINNSEKYFSITNNNRDEFKNIYFLYRKYLSNHFCNWFESLDKNDNLW